MHVESLTKKVREKTIVENLKRRILKKTNEETLKDNMKRRHLTLEDAKNGNEWRVCCRQLMDADDLVRGPDA